MAKKPNPFAKMDDATKAGAKGGKNDVPKGKGGKAPPFGKGGKK